MQDLRLVGVHDDGEHLLLSGTGGEMFRLRIDEALRVAASRPAQRPSSALAGREPAMRLSPRDIQMQIRSGATAESVAESAGIPLAHVQRYEGPVLAEREYIARQARGVEIAAAIPGHDGYRSAFGDEPATLEDMVRYRLAAFGVDPGTLEWDAWRRPEGSWTVIANFDASSSGASIGEPAPAQWVFNPGRKSVQNSNRWAQQLSELEPLDGPLPARRLSAVADRPFDFESDAAPESAADGRAAENSGKEESQGLLDMLRSRRGQRLGVDENEDDALAVLLTNGIPAAHPRTGVGAEDGGGRQDGGPSGTEDVPAERPFLFGKLTLAPLNDVEPADALALHEVSTDTREIRIPALPAKEPAAPATDPATPTTEPDDSPAKPERRTAMKPKRSSVPSWDEIVFGTKGD